MSLKTGAQRIVNQCLEISPDERVVLVNDGNDFDLIRVLKEELEELGVELSYLEYEEPERHGMEPPDRVAKALRESDVFIAPTLKSISHTTARRKACESGARGATLPGINREIWNSSLQADYYEVKRITDRVYDQFLKTTRVRVVTPSGSDFSFAVDTTYFHRDTGMIHQPGEFGNLPAGEADGPALDFEGTFVIDHFPWAPRGTRILAEESRIVGFEHPEPDMKSELHEAIETVEGATNVAEFGFGTNPEATLIGNVLQDEKVLGTVHVAFGDNSSYLPEDHSNHVTCDVHWDSVCEKPTVWFDEKKMIQEGEPVFLEEL